MSRWWVLSDDYPPQLGGVATWSQSVADGLYAAGHEVVVLTRQRDGLTGQGVQVRGVRGRSFARHGGRWVAWAASIRAGDRVLATTWPMATGVIRRCARLGVPLHVVAHGSDVTRAPSSMAARRQVLDHATWWSVSEYLANRVRSMGTVCGVLPAPVQARVYHPPDAMERWVHVGRATRLKGADRVIRLAAAAGVPLDVVGDGPELPKHRALALGLGADVRFHGGLPRHEVASAVRGRHAALLLPRCDIDGSGAEGFGLVLSEAAALGVPAIGCRVGGVAQAVGPGLVLDDPDNVALSVQEIRAWWTLDRGRQAYAHLRDNHGVQRVVDALEHA